MTSRRTVLSRAGIGTLGAVAPVPSEEAGLGNQVSLMQQGKLAMQITNPGGNANFKTV